MKHILLGQQEVTGNLKDSEEASHAMDDTVSAISEEIIEGVYFFGAKLV